MPHALSPDYRWSAAHRRRFLETLAETGSVLVATSAVSKSRTSAYGMRQRDRVFAIGWDAAIIVARGMVSSELLAAAMASIALKPVRNAQTQRIGWRRADALLRAGMGMTLLNRLDRSVEAASQRDPDHDAASAAQDFDAFLDLTEADVSQQDLRAFLAARAIRRSLRVHCPLAQTSAISALSLKPALAHGAPHGHPHRQTPSGRASCPAPAQ